MAPKTPPPPVPPKPQPQKNFFKRLNEYLDSERGREKTAVLVTIFFILAVLMSYLYFRELGRDKHLLEAVASIRRFAVEYDPSLQDKTDLEILAVVDHFALILLNWTLKNEELQKELNTLVRMLPGWHSFEKNLYYFSNVRKTWKASRDDCLARHTADLVTCKLGEEQGFIDEFMNTEKQTYWIGLVKNDSVSGGLLWVNGAIPKEKFWRSREPNGGNREQCIAVQPRCPPKKCWIDTPCTERNFFCCMMKPKSMWFY